MVFCLEDTTCCRALSWNVEIDETSLVVFHIDFVESLEFVVDFKVESVAWQEE